MAEDPKIIIGNYNPNDFIVPLSSLRWKPQWEPRSLNDEIRLEVSRAIKDPKILATALLSLPSEARNHVRVLLDQLEAVGYEPPREIEKVSISGSFLSMDPRDRILREAFGQNAFTPQTIDDITICDVHVLNSFMERVGEEEGYGYPCFRLTSLGEERAQHLLDTYYTK